MCRCGVCNVLVCLCLGFVMCGLFRVCNFWVCVGDGFVMRVCVVVGFVMCESVYV